MSTDDDIDDDTSTNLQSPAGVIARAVAMEAADDHAGAHALLVKCRPQWKKVPPPYDAALARTAFRAGDFAAAAAHFGVLNERLGDKMSASARRTFGTALVRAGQTLEGGHQLSLAMAAGTSVQGRQNLMAVEAYLMESGAAFDAPAPSLERALARASLLIQGRRFADAAGFLAAERDRLTDVPPEYDGMLGRATLWSGDPEGAIGPLRRAVSASAEPVAVNLRHPLGVALLQVGQVAAGGAMLSGAYADGGRVTQPNQMLAINLHRRASGDAALLDITFPEPFTFVDHDHKLIYVSIPKNAATLLKAMFVASSRHRADYVVGATDVHRFGAAITAGQGALEPAKRAAYFKFVVLRDPAERLLSTYLSTFVRGRDMLDPGAERSMQRAVRAAQALIGEPADLGRSISFETFVRYLAVTDDVLCDSQWAPQACITGPDLSIYDHVGRVERLGETLALLAARFGYVAETDVDQHLQPGATHITRYDPAATLAQPFRALPATLDAFVDGMPPKERFLTAEIREMIIRRYAADYALLAG